MGPKLPESVDNLWEARYVVVARTAAGEDATVAVRLDREIAESIVYRYVVWGREGYQRYGRVEMVTRAAFEETRELVYQLEVTPPSGSTGSIAPAASA